MRIWKIPLVSEFLRMCLYVRAFYLWFENFYVHVYKLSQMSTDAVSGLSPNCSPTIFQLLILTSSAVCGSEVSIIGDKVSKVTKVTKCCEIGI